MSFRHHPTWVEIVQMAMLEVDTDLSLDILTVVGHSLYHSNLLRGHSITKPVPKGDFVVVKKSGQINLDNHIFIAFVSVDGIAIAEHYTESDCIALRFDMHEPDALETITDMFRQAIEHPCMVGRADLGLSIMWRLEVDRSTS